MKEYTLKLPVSAMRNALKALDVTRKVQAGIDAEIAALPVLDAEMDGKRALEKREKDLEAFEARKKESSRIALEAIKAAREACLAEINRQTVPSGADITGEHEADFKLLEYGLVSTPEQLEQIASAHDAPAFRAMVRKYADDHEWTDFSYFDKESSVRAFTNDFFSQCEKAASAPSGYFGMLLENHGELERQAVDSGLSAEFAKGNTDGE